MLLSFSSGRSAAIHQSYPILSFFLSSRILSIEWSVLPMMTSHWSLGQSSLLSELIVAKRRNNSEETGRATWSEGEESLPAYTGQLHPIPFLPHSIRSSCRAKVDSKEFIKDKQITKMDYTLGFDYSWSENNGSLSCCIVCRLTWCPFLPVFISDDENDDEPSETETVLSGPSFLLPPEP